MGAIVADETAALVRVSLVEQTLDRDVDQLRVAEEPFAVGGRELERFRVAVEELERSRAEGRDVVPLEQIERHRNERTLRPWATRVDVDPAIRRVRGRLDPHVLRPQVVL